MSITHVVIHPGDETNPLISHWLAFHKNIFSTYSCSEEWIEPFLLKFCPNWKRQDRVEPIAVELTWNEFYFGEEGEHWNAIIGNTSSIPNNLVDFLSNVVDVSIRPPPGRSIIQGTEKPFQTLLAKEKIADKTSLHSNHCTLYIDYQTKDNIDLSPRENTKNMMDKIKTKLHEFQQEPDPIYYLDCYQTSNYGKDRVILLEDSNLLENTDFNTHGYRIFPLFTENHPPFPINAYWRKWMALMTGIEDSQLEKYHTHINNETHAEIIHNMPYRTSHPQIKTFEEMATFINHMVDRVSEITKKRVKLFNDDIWVRICRPDVVSMDDFNPCHRDVYLDFYRNVVNIYIPIVGSNADSSLKVQPRSHLWNEKDIMATKGGAYFKNSGKKYSVDAIVQSREKLNMVAPNPAIDEFLLFSPYLIHGCSANSNTDMTRMSIEMRFIEDNANGLRQEKEFQDFLKCRTWR